MLFVYLLEDKQPYSDQVVAIHRRMTERGDTLCASAFTLGELLVGPRKQGDHAQVDKITRLFSSGEIEVASFDRAAAVSFAQIRSAGGVSSADAIHLACAVQSRVDLFLTNDLQVRKMIVPGIQFIDGLNTTALGTSKSDAQ